MTNLPNTLRALAVTTALQMATAGSTVTLANVAPLAAKDLGLPSSLVGTYVSIVYVGAAIAVILSGGLVRRFGPIAVESTGLALVALGLALGTWALIPALVLSGIILGLGHGVQSPAATDILVRNGTPGHMGFIFSLKQMGVPLACALVGLTMPALGSALGWRAALLAMAGLCLAGTAAALPLRRRYDTHADPAAKISLGMVSESIRLVLRVPDLRTIAIVSFLYNGLQLCLYGFTVSYMVEARHTSVVFAGLVLSTAHIGGIFARPFWGWFSDATQAPKATLVGLGVGMAAFTVLLTLLPADAPDLALLATTFAIGVTCFGVSGLFFAENARIVPPQQAGIATGGTVFFSYVGAILVPVGFGILTQWIGWSPAFWIAAAPSAAAALYMALFYGRGRQS